MNARAWVLLAGVAAGTAALTGLTGAHRGATEAPPPTRLGAAAPARTFKVATWNIRSGMGTRGFRTTSWRSDTLNCTDPSQPLNAWGIGLPQRELAGLASDRGVVALALQEAWNCASPRQVNSVLRFAAVTASHQGVVLIARHGFASPPAYHVVDQTHDRWLIGGWVCLDAECSAAVPMYSTHWGGSTDDDFPGQAERTLSALAPETEPHLFMGDLNVYRRDRWNPAVSCTGPDSTGRTRALSLIAQRGYTDAWRATQRTEGWTGMASRRACGHPRGNLWKRIDYVFAHRLTVVATTRFARSPPGADSPSDHVGLTAELAWPHERMGRISTPNLPVIGRVSR